MKTELALISLIALAGMLFFQGENTTVDSSFEVFQKFQEWKAEYGMVYTNSSEESYRLANFAENLKFVEAHNAKKSSVTLKMTKFAAMTLNEYREVALTEIIKADEYEVADLDLNQDLPSSVNWIEKGAVTPVQNQGSCGSCWAFATTAGLEGLYYNVNKSLMKLSEQQILSCTPAPFSLGCGGGNALFAYQYTAKAGIETESDYPYTDVAAKKASPCKYDKSKTVFNNKGAKVVPQNDVKAFQAALSQQVVSVSVDAANVYFQLYGGGVLENEHCGSKLDHAVTAVGYDMDADKPYWLVKNSWGASWGEKGYIKIGVTDGNGICGINMSNTYPTPL